MLTLVSGVSGGVAGGDRTPCRTVDSAPAALVPAVPSGFPLQVLWPGMHVGRGFVCTATKR